MIFDGYGKPIIIFFLLIIATCTNDDVCLVGGSGDYEGNVQVCINKTWGYICDNGWDVSDSTVVCSQLGYTTSSL